MRIRVWAVAAAVVVLLTGCVMTRKESGGSREPVESVGGPATSAPPTQGATNKKPVPAACAVLSNPEVRTLTGQEIDEIADTSLPNDPDQSGCIWNLTPGGALYLSYRRSDAEQFALHRTGAQKVDGVGTEAYFDGIHLVVLIGDLDVDIIMRSGESDAKHLDRSIQVAKAVTPRLTG